MKVYMVIFNDGTIYKLFSSRQSAVSWIDLQERWWDYQIREMNVED